MVAAPGLPAGDAAERTLGDDCRLDRFVAFGTPQTTSQGQQAVTRERLVEASILLRGAELHDLDALLGDGCSHAGIQRLANRDPLAWTMRVVEVGRLVHMARCLPLLAVVANILPKELK